MWEQEFDATILLIGFNIEPTAIIEYYSTDNLIIAQILGTEVYDVRIDLSETSEKAQCTCPYFKGGRLCKHIAAIMFKYDAQGRETKLNMIGQYVEGLDAIEAKALLMELVKQKHEVQEHVKSSDQYRKQTVNLETLKASVDHLIEVFSGEEEEDSWEDYNHYDDYDFGIPAYDSLLEQFVLDVTLMSEGGHYEIAYEAVIYYFNAVADALLEEHSVDNSYFFERGIPLLEFIKPQLNIAQSRYCFELIFQILIIDNIYYGVRDLFTVWEEMFISPSILEDRLVYAKEQLQQLGEDVNPDLIDSWVLIILKTYFRLGVFEGERLVYIDRYIMNMNVASYYIDELFKDGNYHEVISRTERFLEDKELSHYSKFCYMLKDSYKLVGDINKYQVFLTYLLRNGLFDLDLFDQYKESYTLSEWEMIRTDFIQSLSFAGHRAEGYYKEKMYPQLMDSLIQSENLDLLVTYQEVLKDEFLEEIITMYQNELRRMVVHTGGRFYYQEIVGYMRSMMSLGTTKKEVQELIKEFQTTYSSRPAMRDELKQFNDSIKNK